MLTKKLEEEKKLYKEHKFNSALLCFQTLNKISPNHTDTLCDMGVCYNPAS